MNKENTKAFGTQAAEAPLKPMYIQRREITPTDIELKYYTAAFATPTFTWHATTRAVPYIP